MPKKTPRVDAFVDESIRGQTYYLCAVLIPIDQQSQIRQGLKKIAMRSNHRRLHFNSETVQKKIEIIELFTEKVDAVFVQSQVRHGIKQEDARQKCLAVLVKKLQADGIHRMYIESRSNDRRDELTILRVRSTGPASDFVHLDPYEEELLWCPDALAWTIGAGSIWKERISRLTQQIIEVV